MSLRSVAFRYRCLGAIALLSAIAIGPSVNAQTPPQDPGGKVGEYLAEYRALVARSQLISQEIAGIAIQMSYCTSDQRTAHGHAIGTAQGHLDALTSAFVDFKFKWERFLKLPGSAAQFDAAKMPISEQFFDAPHKEIVTHVANDLANARAAWMASKVEDCNPPRRRAVATQPPARREPARRNPLEGLTRPPVPPREPLPDMPPPFCSYTAMWDWHDANLLPRLKRHQDAQWALMTYSYKVIDASKERYDARDTASLRVLRAEKKWIDDTHAEQDAAYWELAKFRDQLKVIDCTPPKPPEEPKAAVEEKTGINWRVGIGLDYAGYPDFKKVVGDQSYSTGVEAKTGTTGFAVSVGVDTKRWGCGLSGHFNSLSYEQTYDPPEINLARESTGKLDGTFIDASCGPHLRLWGLEFGGFFGATYAINQLSFSDRFSNGQIVTGSRDLTNWKSNFGLTLEVPVRPHFGLRFDLTKTLGGWSGDADRNARIGIGLDFRSHPF